MAITREQVELELAQHKEELISYLLESEANRTAYHTELQQRFMAHELRDKSHDSDEHLQAGSLHPDRLAMERLYFDAGLYQYIVDLKNMDRAGLLQELQSIEEELRRQ
jgi:hypothetical protein